MTMDHYDPIYSALSSMQKFQQLATKEFQEFKLYKQDFQYKRFFF